MHEVHVESQVDGRDRDQHVSRCAHDPCGTSRRKSDTPIYCNDRIAQADGLGFAVNLGPRPKEATRTLTLQVLLQALEADVARSADDQDAQDRLYVTAESFFLAKSEKDGFYESPEQCNGNEQQPKEGNAALEVD